jgi:hypothetical protein
VPLTVAAVTCSQYGCRSAGNAPFPCWSHAPLDCRATLSGKQEQQQQQTMDLPSSNSPALHFQVRASVDGERRCVNVVPSWVQAAVGVLHTASLQRLCALPAVACVLQVLAQQGRARTATMKLPHYTAETPMFMPVGTQGEQHQFSISCCTTDSLDCCLKIRPQGTRPARFSVCLVFKTVHKPGSACSQVAATPTLKRPKRKLSPVRMQARSRV